jgi:hypothetical protein
MDRLELGTSPNMHSGIDEQTMQTPKVYDSISMKVPD